MTEDVGETGEVVGLFVVTEGEEPPQVVGKDAAWVDAGGAREGFQTGPDLIPAERTTACGAKERATGDLFCPGETSKAFAQGGGKEDHTDLALEVDLSAAGLHGLNGDVRKLADADACGGEGFQEQRALTAGATGGGMQALVVAPRELAGRVTEKAALHTLIAKVQIGTTEMGEESVQCGELGIDTGRGVAGAESGLPAEQRGFIDGALACQAKNRARAR